MILALGLLFSSCKLDLPVSGDSDEDIPYAAYIKVASGLQSDVRFLTGDQLAGQINYYELIVEKLGGGDVPTGEFFSARGYKRAGSLVVPVEIGAKYNVLLLQGYRPDDGSSSTLLKADFDTVGPVIAGANIFDTIADVINLDPSTDFSLDYKFTSPLISGTETPSNLNADNLMTLHVPVGTTDAVDNALKVTIRHSTALLQALKGGDLSSPDPTVDFTTGGDVPFSSAKLIMEQIYGPASTDSAVTPWDLSTNVLADYDYTVADEISKTFPIPAGYDFYNASGRLYLDCTYYGFVRKADSGSLPGSPNGTPAWTAANAQTAGFTKWTVRNGISSEWDKTGKPGGAVYLKMGNGGDSAPGAGGTWVTINSVILSSFIVKGFSGPITIDYIEPDVQVTGNADSVTGAITVRNVALPTSGIVKSIKLGTNPVQYIARDVSTLGAAPIDLQVNSGGVVLLRPAVGGSIPIGSWAEFHLINTSTTTKSYHYKQEADLDLMGGVGSGPGDWAPIGPDGGGAFTGTFDGAGFQIKRLQITGAANDVGLFGETAGGSATIKNVHIAAGSSVEGNLYTGGIVGDVQAGAKVIGCSNAGTITGNQYVGGIAGSNEINSTTTGCYNTGTITSTTGIAGGIAGINDGMITGCRNDGTINGPGYIGGIAGWFDHGTAIACYNTGAIVGGSGNSIGGIVGITGVNGPGNLIAACYNIGLVTGSGSDIGSVVGTNNRIVTDCYWVGPAAAVGVGSVTDGGLFTSPAFPPSTVHAEWGTDTVDPGTSGHYWKDGTTGGGDLPRLWWEK
ncbi:hypothetical protein AGMMS50293_14560 [Spirochaetia bacterium]|nr:hypothetical protein AGMMS50293_14560 [Spirochaetia bacterium]